MMLAGWLPDFCHKRDGMSTKIENSKETLVRHKQKIKKNNKRLASPNNIQLYLAEQKKDLWVFFSHFWLEWRTYRVYRSLKWVRRTFFRFRFFLLCRIVVLQIERLALTYTQTHWHKQQLFNQLMERAVHCTLKHRTVASVCKLYQCETTILQCLWVNGGMLNLVR